MVPVVIGAMGDVPMPEPEPGKGTDVLLDDGYGGKPVDTPAGEITTELDLEDVG